jgi:hypothetical protein
MIHVIPVHIKRGSYSPWYSLLYFKEPFNLIDIENVNDFEQNAWKYNFIELFNIHLSKIDIQPDDSILLDTSYFNFDSIEELTEKINVIAEKYKCKFFVVDDDNQFDFTDTKSLTYFSNRFNVVTDTNNFNYFRYRAPFQYYWKEFDFVTDIFLKNYRQKKMNMIVGVDKIERIKTFKYVYDIGLNNDSWLGYSSFVRSYTDSQIDKELLEFRNNTIPIILDATQKMAYQGNITVEAPPLPITMTSYVSCILETAILLDGQIHLSEKSWNPFISKNIPLILGSTHINTYLKQLGFWMADDLFDLTPQFTRDSILEQYKTNLDIINKMSMDDLHDYYNTNKDNINSNFKLLQNQKFIFDRNNYK